MSQNLQKFSKAIKDSVFLCADGIEFQETQFARGPNCGVDFVSLLEQNGSFNLDCTADRSEQCDVTLCLQGTCGPSLRTYHQ